MTVAYEKLARKAIKGPLTRKTLQDGTVIIVRESLARSANGHRLPATEHVCQVVKDEATADLLVHCFNHFEKTVRALEWCFARTMPRIPGGDEPGCMCDIQDILRMARRVEID